MKRLRMYATLLVITAAIVGIGFMPLPSHVYCPLEVQARGAASVYVWQDGILEKIFVRPGDQVAEGQLLAQLRNIDVDIEIDELTGQRNVYDAQLKGLNLVSLADRKASLEIEATTESLASTDKQLTQLERRSQLAAARRPAGRHSAAASAGRETGRRVRPPADLARLAART